jgi:hypothetical protein
MPRLVYLEARPPQRLFARFDDGVQGEDDMAGRLNGPMFAPLRDPAFFAQVTLSAWGAPLWPNGLDTAPDALYERLRAQGAYERRA